MVRMPISVEKLARLFEVITGRKPTEFDIEAARRTLAKAMHVLVAMIMLGSIAMAEPLPIRSHPQANVPETMSPSGGFCVPKLTGVAVILIRRAENVVDI